MTVGTRQRIAEKLPKLEIGATSGMVEHLRQVKDKEELALIRGAARIAEKSFAVIRAGLRLEQTEKQIGDALEHQMRLFGGDGPAFDSIVAVGLRAALPHAKLADQHVGGGDILLVDWGAQWRLYKSDLTRVLVTGKISTKLRRVYEVVLSAQAKAIKAIRPGVPTTEVDAAARKVIAEAGFQRRFNHGIGHGLGLEIHESPRMTGKNTAALKPGMVVTVEPGVYIPGWGGVRIEDDVLVTRDGHEVLTSLPKQFEEMVVFV
jgi:Xaa-Pro aminopeptidase